MDKTEDIFKSKKGEDGTKVLSGRVPEKYATFVKEHNIDVKKLIMRACEELDEKLKGE